MAGVSEEMIAAGLSFMYNHKHLRDIPEFWNLPIAWRKNFVKGMYEVMKAHEEVGGT